MSVACLLIMECEVFLECVAMQTIQRSMHPNSALQEVGCVATEQEQTGQPLAPYAISMANNLQVFVFIA